MLTASSNFNIALPLTGSPEDSGEDNQRCFITPSAIPNLACDVKFMHAVHHLFVRTDNYFCCCPKLENNRLQIQITVPSWVGIDAVAAVIRNWKSINKITVFNLPMTTLHALINLIGTTKETTVTTFLKLQSCAIHPDYLRYFINVCPNLKSLFLPQTLIVHGVNLLDIVVQGKRLENLDLETTVGIRVPSYIFQWLQSNNRVFRIFGICPRVVINRGHLYSYIPYWETYLNYDSRSKDQQYQRRFNVRICIRTDQMPSYSCMQKKELDDWMKFIVNVNNNFFDSQLMRHGQLRAAGKVSYVRTTVRAVQLMPAGRIIFDIPSIAEFDTLADEVYKKSLENDKIDAVEAADNKKIHEST